ncbi:MAG: beta-ketoacyl-[acyl-carrier-protein] synthase family protein [Bacteroidales bacterium]
MPERIFVTGIGLITAAGKNVPENEQSLRTGHSGIGEVKFLNTVHKEIPVAEVKHDDKALFDLAGIPYREGYTRTALLGMIAAGEAMQNAGADPGGPRTGLISATTVGGMVKSENHYFDFLRNDESNIYIGTHDCGDSTDKIARRLGIHGFRSTISTACSSSLNSIILGARLIRAGKLDRALVGGTDALSRFTLNGFNSLMILDREGCKPFDKNRNGLTLGEGAGYLVLESETEVRKRNALVLAEVTGWANANDAFHQTASSPEGTGAFMAMEKALETNHTQADAIDYINAHGTGTINNDLSEGRAIEKLFGDRIPRVSSTKAYTGHTLGAAGSVEAVFSVVSIVRNVLIPNMHYRDQMPELHFAPETEYKEEAGIRTVITNSFGFGGNNSSLILKG